MKPGKPEAVDSTPAVVRSLADGTDNLGHGEMLSVLQVDEFGLDVEQITIWTLQSFYHSLFCFPPDFASVTLFEHLRLTGLFSSSNFLLCCHLKLQLLFLVKKRIFSSMAWGLGPSDN